MSGKHQSELVIIPSPGRGHLQATLQLANLLINTDPDLSISVLVIKPFSLTNNASAPPSDDHSSVTGSRVRFIDVPPPVDFSPPSTASINPLFVRYQYFQSHRDNVRDEVAKIIQELGTSSHLGGFIVDMMCAMMADVADEFGVPTYVFYTSGASFLGLMFQVQSMMDDQDQDFAAYENSGKEINFPSYTHPVPVKLLPSMTFDKSGIGATFFRFARRYRSCAGILINTFSEFEIHGVKAISEDPNIPSIFPIGPLIHPDNGNDDNPKYTEIMNWLDHQPDSSVLFLCFGSRGWFEEAQVKEIALALERSGQRFLWSLRKPPPNKGIMESPGEYENPEEVLPEGFLQRTAGIGRVIGWAPQVAVLSHSAVGGFISHCGWNSTLESMWCGVPMGAWPLYAEQQTNAFQLVKDLGVGVEIKMDYQRGGDVIVSAEEIEKGIKLLMEPESNIRAKAEAMKSRSRAALSENGSSFDFVRRFLDDVTV